MILDFESSIFELGPSMCGIHADLNRVGTAMLPRIPVQILRGNGTQTHPVIHQRGAGAVPASKRIDSSGTPLASLRSAISDFPSRGPSTCSVPSRAGTVLQSCDGIGRRASKVPWQGCLSRLLTLWLSFLNQTVLEAPHAHSKLDVGITPLPDGACTLRTPAAASPSALPAGWNAIPVLRLAVP